MDGLRSPDGGGGVLWIPVLICLALIAFAVLSDNSGSATPGDPAPDPATRVSSTTEEPLRTFSIMAGLSRRH